MKARNCLRYATLLGVSIAHTVRVRRYRFEADLARQREQLSRMLVAQPEPSFCGVQCTRLTGEVVTCYLPWDHQGFHAGRAQGLTEAFTWPDRDNDSQQKPRPALTCACNSTRLRADIVQVPDEWKWRVYDVGCDEMERTFAIGASEDLDESREDVTDVMRMLADTGGYAHGAPNHYVTHHVTMPIEFVGGES